MKQFLFYTAGASPALLYARNQLAEWGFEVSQEPSPEVTHVLLPVPSLDDTGNIRGGTSLEALLQKLPENVTVYGGNLGAAPCNCVDFLKDEYYLAENAAITAHCALHVAMNHISGTFKGAKVLIIGWGRIGKCLAALIKNIGAETTVAVRKKNQCAILSALGYHSVLTPEIKPHDYQIIFNTVPSPVLCAADAAPDTLLIDLASKQGITGDGVIWARGLPGKEAPAASGALIAKTALRYAFGKESTI